MTQANSPSNGTVTNSPGPSQAGNSSGDPLLGLHKMSMTAGLGSTEYVAVNVTAVVSIIFALAGVLAVLANLLLLIPLTGSILGLVALRQVRNSNGTQTGKGLALIGLGVSALLIVGVLGNQALRAYREKDEEKAITALCQNLGQLIAGNKFDEAYPLFDEDFRSRNSLDAFKVRLEMMQQNTVVTPIVSIDTSGLMRFSESEFGDLHAEAVMRTHYQSGREPGMYDIQLRRTNGKWLIDDIPDMFPPPQKPGGNGGSPTGS